MHQPLTLFGIPISLIIVFVFAVGIPLFFIPIAGAPFQFSKIILAIFLVVAAIVFYGARILTSGVAHVRIHSVALAALLLPFAVSLAALFAPHPPHAFVGYEFESDTAAFLMLLSGVCIATLTIVESRTHIFAALFGFLAGAWGVFLVQAISLAFGPLTWLGFSSTTDNLIGSWNDFGLFSGLVALLVLIILSTLRLSVFFRNSAWVTLVVSLIGLMLTNFTVVWIGVGIIAFILSLNIIVRRLVVATGSDAYSIRIPIAVMVVALVAVFFPSIPTNLQSLVGIETFEVRPSIEGTISVLSGVYKEDPFFGAGPNHFDQGWLQYRPAGVLVTPFWNVGFTNGFGFIPTAVVTGGMVVGIFWLMYIVAVVFATVRALLMVSGGGQDRSYFIVSATAVLSLFLLVMHLVYVPSQTLSLIWFFMVGLFIASLSQTSLIRDVTISFNGSPRIAFSFVVGVSVLSLGALSFLYTAGVHYVSAFTFNQALISAAAGDTDAAFAGIVRAASFSEQDRYYRAAALIDISRMQAIVEGGNTNNPDIQASFRDALTRAVSNAAAAVEANESHFDNWFTRAAVYASVVPLGINGAYENALQQFDRARALNPTGPEVDLRLAQVHLGGQKNDDARAALMRALSKKQDYTEAILTLADLELREGKLDEATRAVEAAVYFEPQNPVLLYQLGLLRMEGDQYASAATAFEAALIQNTEFQNAAFFLASAYTSLGRFDDAQKLITDLQVKNPDNTLLRDISAGLAAGDNPFTESTARSAPQP